MGRRGASAHLRLTWLVAVLGILLLACASPVPVAPTAAPAPSAAPVVTPRPTATFRPAVPATVLAPPPTSEPNPNADSDSDTPQFTDSQVVQVLIASSIGVPMQQVSMGFLTANPSSARVQMLFDSSQRLVGRIQAGTPADVIVWDDPSIEATLTSAGLLDGDPRVFGRGKLVMVVPAGNPKGLTGLADLAKPGARWAAARPETLLGASTMKLLDAASALPEYGSTFRTMAERNIQLRAENPAEVLERVAEKGADAGIVHASDIPLDQAKQLSVLPLPDGLAADTSYSVGVVKRGPNMQAAHAFMDYLGSDAAQSVLAKYGLAASSPVTAATTP
jgi:molybdate transport system substrate-binding protein